MKTYEVILNAGAMGIPRENSVRIIEADRFETDDNNAAQVTFYEGTEKIAQFAYVLGVSTVPESISE